MGSVGSHGASSGISPPRREPEPEPRGGQEEEEAAEEPHHVQQQPAAGSGESLREDALPRRLRAGGAGQEGEPQRGEGPGERRFVRQKKDPSAFLPRAPQGAGRWEGHRGRPRDPANASPSPCRSGFRTGGPNSAVTRGRCWPTGRRRSSSPTAKKPPSSSPWHRGPRRSAPSTSPGPAPPRTGGCRHRQGQGTGAGTVPISVAAPVPLLRTRGASRGSKELGAGAHPGLFWEPAPAPVAHPLPPAEQPPCVLGPGRGWSRRGALLASC